MPGSCSQRVSGPPRHFWSGIYTGNSACSSSALLRGPSRPRITGAIGTTVCIVWPSASICTLLLLLHYSTTTKALNRGINLKLCPEEMALGDELYPYEWDGLAPHESTSCCNNQIFVLYANAGWGSIWLNSVFYPALSCSAHSYKPIEKQAQIP